VTYEKCLKSFIEERRNTIMSSGDQSGMQGLKRVDSSSGLQRKIGDLTTHQSREDGNHGEVSDALFKRYVALENTTDRLGRLDQKSKPLETCSTELARFSYMVDHRDEILSITNSVSALKDAAEKYRIRAAGVLRTQEIRTQKLHKDCKDCLEDMFTKWSSISHLTDDNAKTVH